jgi:AcrR family transcriptional regulator
MATTSRRGRPRAGERDRRRAAVLEAARAELVERGYDGTTMLGIARRCGASKETLYHWFGDKQSLFATLIAAEGQATADRLRRVLARDEPEPTGPLVAFAEGLLGLLVGPWSVAVNRGAMRSPELAGLVLAHGRHAVGPLVEDHLAALAADGVLDIPDPAEAFRVLYGLIVQDTQIRVLLGERPPSKPARRRQAHTAVDRFWQLYTTGPGRG